eukprot:TRINITY_DN12654_c0_g1_i1.p1 TRINITY_DN12654_c0_g1~~TRINITY_DN12654_c0_g1_i1.p1  ORF type:complete len:278 (-),score=60.68 TRINITY_DN12654_c0_g1_i1:9-842(-)
MYPVFDKMKTPCVIAHRGGAGMAPENTMYAFKKSVECGADMLEMDIQKTKDGKLVLFHNDNIAYNSNGFGSIESFTFEELQEFDFGYNWCRSEEGYIYRGKGIKIPKLEDVIDTFKDSHPDLLFYLDFKEQGIAADVMKLIDLKDISNRVVFGAIDPSIHSELMKIKPKHIPITPDAQEAKTTFITYKISELLLRLKPLSSDAVGFPYSFGEHIIPNERLVTICHAKGKKVFIFSFSDELDQKSIQKDLIKFGVDGLVSDRPDILRKTVDKWKKNCK